jgi:uncharacterized repeat protein (TIGR04076 family)
MRENKVKLLVKSSKCHWYKPGDAIYIEGPLLIKETSGNVCLTAVNAIYPFIYAFRKGVGKEAMGFDELTFQCPDCPDTVEFTLTAY